MKLSVAVIAVLAVVVLAGAGVGVLSMQPATTETVTIGKMPIEAHALLYIAEDGGYFAGNDLTVAVRDYATGPAALDALARGEVDVAASGEYAVVDQAFRKEPVTIIAAIDRYMFFSLAARADRGIANVSDLRGRTIGVARRTSGEFFLGRFLELNGVDLSTVTVRDLPPGEWAGAIANGSVDAVVYNRDREGEVLAALGPHPVVWSVQSGQPLYSVLVCRRDWVANHSATVERLLSGLARAERSAVEDPAGARAALAGRLRLTPGAAATVWEQNLFGLSLDQSLVAAMEDEARWMIANNMTNATAIPDVLEYIEPAPLERVRPDSVKLIN